LQQRMPRALAALFLSPYALIGVDIFSPRGTLAAESVVPPAETVIPSGVPPASMLQYAEVAPGLLERSVFETTKAGPLAIAIVDILVGPGQSAQISTAQFAALVEIQVGAPQLSVDGKSAAAEPGRPIGIDQGHDLTIDNRQAQRGVVARLIKLQAPGN
jgi:hypothetical protein